jgi:hypothetical protein
MAASSGRNGDSTFPAAKEAFFMSGAGGQDRPDDSVTSARHQHLAASSSAAAAPGAEYRDARD